MSRDNSDYLSLIDKQVVKVNALKWPVNVNFVFLPDCAEDAKMKAQCAKLDCVPEEFKLTGAPLAPYGSDYAMLINDHLVKVIENKIGQDLQGSGGSGGRLPSQLDKLRRLPIDPRNIYLLKAFKRSSSHEKAQVDIPLVTGLQTDVIVTYGFSWISADSEMHVIYILMKMISKLHASYHRYVSESMRFGTFTEYKQLRVQLQQKLAFDSNKPDTSLALLLSSPSDTSDNDAEDVRNAMVGPLIGPAVSMHYDDIMEMQAQSLTNPRVRNPKTSLATALTAIMSDRESINIAAHFSDLDHFFSFLKSRPAQDVMDFISRIRKRELSEFDDNLNEIKKKVKEIVRNQYEPHRFCGEDEDDKDVDMTATAAAEEEEKARNLTLGDAIVKRIYKEFMSQELTIKKRTDPQLRRYLQECGVTDGSLDFLKPAPKGVTKKPKPSSSSSVKAEPVKKAQTKSKTAPTSSDEPTPVTKKVKLEPSAAAPKLSVEESEQRHKRLMAEAAAKAEIKREVKLEAPKPRVKKVIRESSDEDCEE